MHIKQYLGWIVAVIASTTIASLVYQPLGELVMLLWFSRLAFWAWERDKHDPTLR